LEYADDSSCHIKSNVVTPSIHSVLSRAKRFFLESGFYVVENKVDLSAMRVQKKKVGKKNTTLHFI
jgi:hypothetical protein